MACRPLHSSSFKGVVGGPADEPKQMWCWASGSDEVKSDQGREDSILRVKMEGFINL